MENKSACLQSHIVLCQLEWFRSGRWSPISGSPHLQGRQWVDMSGWSEESADKDEVCVRCEGVGGIGWGPKKSGNPILHESTHTTHAECKYHTYTHTQHTSSLHSKTVLSPSFLLIFA